MRIESIELSWFRGASASAVLSPCGHSAVVYGSNGAGKSSFADAFEYLVSNGRIGHLSHEYSGTHQKRGIRNTHAPEKAASSIQLKLEGNACFSAQIPPEGAPKFSSDPQQIKRDLQSWVLERFLLRQDEVARFIHATKGEKYSVLLPLLGLGELEIAADNLKTLQKALAERGGLAQKNQQLEDLRRAVQAELTDFSPDGIEETLNKLCNGYLARQVQSEDRLAEIEKAISSRIEDAEPDQKRHLIFQQIQKERLDEIRLRLVEAERKAAIVADALIERRLAVLESAKDFLQALEAGQNFIDCPACGSAVQVDRFSAHVESEMEELGQAHEARKVVLQEREQLRAALLEVRKKCLEPDFSSWLVLTGDEELKTALSLLNNLELNQCEHRWPDAAWQILTCEIPRLCSQVAQILKDVPPSTQQLLEDSQIVEALKKIPVLKNLQMEIEGLERLIGQLVVAEAEVRKTIKTRTHAVMHQVSQEIQHLWCKLHPDEPIEKVELYIPGEADRAIDICLKFYGVDQPSPRLTLSEGHRNSLGLCIFLALVRLDENVDRPIILDDVVSSMDREHRGMLATVLNEDFASRQVILFTHDREWYTELRWRLPKKQWGFFTLRPWLDPITGIQLPSSEDTLGDARILVAIDPAAAGNRARAIMDRELASIAEKLRLRLRYVRGDHNDRRTCNEFLERICAEAEKRLKKHHGGEWVAYKEPIKEWEEAHALLAAWANPASHGGSLTVHEVDHLIKCCEKALEQFRCPECKDPVWCANLASRDRLQCSCGEIQWRYD